MNWVEEDDTRNRMPVALLTGFLGSGKTTLLNRILKDPRLAETAVAINEFGEMALDQHFIDHGEDKTVVMANGCLCCTASGDLDDAVMRIFTRRQSGELPQFKRLVIETSGLADPAPILHALMTDRDIAQHHRIDGIVTVVDALHGEAALDRHAEARRQVALADTLLLSKTDLAVPTERLRARLVALNRDVRLQSAHDIVPTMLFQGTDVAARFSALPDQPARNPFARAQHTDGIETFVVRRDRPMPALALTLLLEALAEHCGARLLRLKGLVSIEEMPGQPAVIHGVQHVFSPPAFLDRWPSADHATRMVFIAQGVPRHFPARLLDAIDLEVREEMEQPAPPR
jgi:G3E family GTPase